MEGGERAPGRMGPPRAVPAGAAEPRAPCGGRGSACGASAVPATRRCRPLRGGGGAAGGDCTRCCGVPSPGLRGCARGRSKGVVGPRGGRGAGPPARGAVGPTPRGFQPALAGAAWGWRPSRRGQRRLSGAS